MDKDERKYLVEAYNDVNGYPIGQKDRLEINLKQRKGRSGSNRLNDGPERELIYNQLKKRGKKDKKFTTSSIKNFFRTLMSSGSGL